MPKPTRTPERIKLPGDFHLDKRNDGTYALFGKGSDWQVGCIGVEAITDFAAAMNGAVELTASKVNELANRRGKSILPQVVAALQSPAGEWRPEQINLMSAISALKGYTTAVGTGMPGYFERLHDHYIANVEKAAAAFLPPAPTGEV